MPTPVYQRGWCVLALSATTIWEVEGSGDDTSNGGAFDPGQTAGMFTDGAATSANTSAPVFSSASYNFVAGDVGAWVFIGSGTNWTKGWYKIVSVAANAATLNGTIGQAVVLPFTTTTTPGIAPSTVVGCATTASPTSATWSIDYSQQTSPKYTYTDLASVGAGLLVSSVAKPFAKEQVGNCLVITSGTNFTAGRYVIVSVAAGVATVVGAANITTGVGASGVGSLGGALASPGKVGAHEVAQNKVYIKTGTYTATSASTNIAAGCLSLAGNLALIEGYDTYRGDLSPAGAAGTRPTIIASGISTFTLVAVGTFSAVRNLILDGAALTASKGASGNSGNFYNVLFKNCTNNGVSGSSGCTRCAATGCSTVAAFATTGSHHFCVAYSNTFTGFGAGNGAFCLAYGNSGASSDGFTLNTAGMQWANCVSYGNGKDGFNGNASGLGLTNNIAEGNTGAGFNITANVSGGFTLNCASYNNTGGARTATACLHYVELGFLTLTGSPFTNAASGDFSLNNTAGAGAACRAAGYPGLMPVGLTTGYHDVGVAQHADPVSGGVNRAAMPSGLSALG